MVLKSNASRTKTSRGRIDQSAGLQPSSPPTEFLFAMVHKSNKSCPETGSTWNSGALNRKGVYFKIKLLVCALRFSTLP